MEGILYTGYAYGKGRVKLLGFGHLLYHLSFKVHNVSIQNAL